MLNADSAGSVRKRLLCLEELVALLEESQGVRGELVALQPGLGALGVEHLELPFPDQSFAFSGSLVACHSAGSGL